MSATRNVRTALAQLPARSHTLYSRSYNAGSVGGRMFELSSGGISSYQKLQLENGLAELAKPAATATGQVKDALDALLSTLPRVSDSSIAESDVKRVLLAANELSSLASSGAEGLKAIAESIVTKSTAFEAAIKSGTSLNVPAEMGRADKVSHIKIPLYNLGMRTADGFEGYSVPTLLGVLGLWFAGMLAIATWLTHRSKKGN